MPFDSASRLTAAPAEIDHWLPRRRVRKVLRYTGHPPPEKQIASQVRSASGYTLGRPSADGAKLYALPSRLNGFGVAAHVSGALHEEMLPTERKPRQLFLALLDLARDGAKLPGLAGLAARLGDDWNIEHVRAALDALMRSGHVDTWTEAGDRVLRLCAAGTEMRTRGRRRGDAA